MNSKRPSEEPISKTARRFYAGMCVVFIGIVTILVSNTYQLPTLIAVGSSLAAGGIASLILIFNDYLDDQSLLESAGNILGTIEALGQGVADLSKISVVCHQAEARCIIEPTPRTQFEELVTALTRIRRRIDIDAMGLTLEKFHKEQLERLSTHKEVVVRLIVQSPDDPIFKQIAKQEKRDSEQEAADSKAFTEYVLTHNVSHKNNPDHHADMQIRWFEGSPSLTMLRINDVIFVRPRFLGPDSEVTVFYEKYSRHNDGRVWETYFQYFNAAWEFSKRPIKKDDPQS